MLLTLSLNGLFMVSFEWKSGSLLNTTFLTSLSSGSSFSLPTALSPQAWRLAPPMPSRSISFPSTLKIPSLISVCQLLPHCCWHLLTSEWFIHFTLWFSLLAYCHGLQYYLQHHDFICFDLKIHRVDLSNTWLLSSLTTSPPRIFTFTYFCLSFLRSYSYKIDLIIFNHSISPNFLLHIPCYYPLFFQYSLSLCFPALNDLLATVTSNLLWWWLCTLFTKPTSSLASLRTLNSFGLLLLWVNNTIIS